MLDRDSGIRVAIITLVLSSLYCAEAQCQTMPWVRNGASAPAGRYNFAMTYDAARQNVVLFGGSTTVAESKGTWTWDGKAWTQVKPASAPSARNGHAMTYDSARQQVVLFGGYSRGYVGDTWLWDGKAWTQAMPTASPPARSRASLVYDATRKQVILFGGLTSTGHLADTWTWDGKNWTQKKPSSSPPARYGHAMAYDPIRQRTVLFGGQQNSSRTADTWTWDGKTWTPHIFLKSYPSPRKYHAMVNDTSRQRVVLFGGFTSSQPTRFAADTWIWDGRAWTQAKPSVSPTARSSHAMAYDAARKNVVLFGGLTGAGRQAETWLYGLRQIRGSFAPFGKGCGPTPHVLLAAMSGSKPTIGRRFFLSTTNTPKTSTIGVISLGTSNKILGPFPLPVSLAPFGMPGCNLYHSYEMTIMYPLRNGTGTATLQIPNYRSLTSVKLYVQAMVAAPKANVAQILSSNAGTMLIGNM